MARDKFFKIILFFSLFSIPLRISASSNIVINEICWMGNSTSSADEWIEIYNPTKENISLEGWLLKRADKKVNLKGGIKAFGFFLLERTDDESASDVPADQIYKGALSNKGEKLILENEKGEIIDSIDCSPGWFSGDNKTKQTMSRISHLVSASEISNWKNSQSAGGTPKAENNFEKQPESIKKGSLSQKEMSLDLTGSEGEIDSNRSIKWRDFFLKSFIVLGLILILLIILKYKNLKNEENS